jgi:hypothetical protein
MVFVDSDRCPDCGAEPGMSHEFGCDVARCKTCGFQELSCEHESAEMTEWTGGWPGDAEVEEGLADDLVHLYVRRLNGELEWDPVTERWRVVGGTG